MGVSLHIPDSIAQAIRLPEERMPEALMAELAVTLYERGLLSLGKAQELAGMDRDGFGRLLAARGVSRHYGEQELAEDLAYAHR
jgi:predicted HTH domain antitoxin